MAKIVCIKSGVVFGCEHMPTSIATTHPIFNASQHKLLSLAGKWGAQQLTTTESYLLFLALLDSTTLVQWRTHTAYNPNMDAIVANNMHNLISIIGKINIIKSPSLALPAFVITPETSTLSNVNHWIEAWEQTYVDWYEGNREARLREALKTREEALQRLIKSQSRNPAQYAKTLASWAVTAGSFPSFTITHPISKAPITLSDYWSQLILAASNEDRLWRYPREDIVELIDHCEDNITHGNIYAHALMKYLRNALDKYDDYLGFGDISASSTSFTIMPSSATAAEINAATALSTAPDEEPQKHQYATHYAWLKAYTKWKFKQVK